MWRVSAGWVAVSYAGGPETRRVGSRSSQRHKRRGHQQVSRGSSCLECHNSPSGITPGAKDRASPGAARQASQNGRAKTYMNLKLPVQGAVDRAAVIDIYLIPNPVHDPDEPQGVIFGALPGDPAWFPESVNPRVAVCKILPGYAAASCLGARGYF